MPYTTVYSFFENLQIYLIDLVDVFYTILETDMVQNSFKNVKSLINNNFLVMSKEMEDHLIGE
jgi:hypothetical protein